MYQNVKAMKPNENQNKRNTDPSNVSQNPTHKQSKTNPADDDQSTTYVDLDKANFADRKHGRTTDSLGPDHEPGTV